MSRAGSAHAASVCNTVANGCDQAAENMRADNRTAADSGVIEIYAKNTPEGAGPAAMKKLYAGRPNMVEDEKHLMPSHSY
jgi:hypothetical protein